jgi:hypothetical protein
MEDLVFAIAFSFPNLFFYSRAVVVDERRNNADKQLCTRNGETRNKMFQSLKVNVIAINATEKAGKTLSSNEYF